jgi:hypothetical protein
VLYAMGVPMYYMRALSLDLQTKSFTSMKENARTVAKSFL